jgi:hypothetical protein
MGIRDRPVSARSPWQNGYAKRLIGSIRRECLDHVVVVGERHLRHVLASYQTYNVQANMRAKYALKERDARIAELIVNSSSNTSITPSASPAGGSVNSTAASPDRKYNPARSLRGLLGKSAAGLKNEPQCNGCLRNAFGDVSTSPVDFH